MYLFNVWVNYGKELNSTTLWANTADDKLAIFFLFFLLSTENKTWYYVQIVFIGDNLHEMSNLVAWEK